jgi:Zn-finger nucleic acid-binding protein
MLDATDAPCPRCAHPLEVSPGDDTRIHECPRCGGMFVPRELLAELLCSAELGGGLRTSTPKVRLDEVRYVPCPLCHSSMNRVNFGRVSGVIVDVCKMHGTWFDAGELTRVIAFAASGGLEKTRAREKSDHREERQRASEVHAQLAVMEAQTRSRSRADDWNDFLNAIFSW